jgi:uncharacterized repeat protein (TIGR01451 family)
MSPTIAQCRILATVAASFFALAPGFAAVNTFTNRSAFTAAVASSTTIDFEGVASGGKVDYSTAAGLTVSGVNFVGASIPAVGYSDYFLLVAVGSGWNGTAVLAGPFGFYAIPSAGMPARNGDLTVKLPAGTTAVGVDFLSRPDASDNRGLNVLLGDQVFVANAAGNGSPGFFGIVSDTPFTTIVFRASAASFEWSEYFFDNFTFGQARPISATCLVKLTPASAGIGVSGGTGTVNVDPGGSDCAWTASSNVGWISIAANGSGKGAGTLTYSVAGNQGSGVSRSDTISFNTIAGQSTFQISQAGAGCTYSMPRASQAFTAAGGSGSATVLAPYGCGVEWSGGAPWITGAGVGEGGGLWSYTESINYFTVAPNTGASPRAATLTAGGLNFTVTQPGAGGNATCSAQVSQPSSAAIEGRTETLGDLVLTCSGLNSAVLATVSLVLNTNVTNKPVSGTTDAMLVASGVPVAGQVAGYNTLRWAGVALGPGTTTLRITSVRADASLLGTPGDLKPTPVSAQVVVAAPSPLPVGYGSQNISCGTLPANSVVMACARPTLVFQKGQASPPAGGAQTIVPVSFQDGAAAGGGIRLRVVLSRIPANVQVYAPVYPSDGAANAQLYSADANGLGGSPVTGVPMAGAVYQPLTATAGTAMATWVVTSINKWEWTFPLLLTNASSSDLNQIQVAGSLGPVSDVSVATETAPVPRYRDFSVPQKLVSLRLTTSFQGAAKTTPLVKTGAWAGSSAAGVTAGSNVSFVNQLVNDTSDPNQTATNVVVRDNLPSGLSFVSCTATGGASCTGAGSSVQVNYGTLGPGQNRTVTVTAQVDPSLADGTVLENPVSASSDQANADLGAALASSSFIVLNGTPVAAGSQPSSGAGTSQGFTFQFSHPSGWQNLGVVNILVNNALDGRRACYLAYVVQSSALYLVNDAGQAGGPYAGSVTLGSPATIQNSQCTVGLTSAAGNGNTLALTLNITFAASFGGNKIAYVAARDGSGNNSNWQALGVWQVPWSPAGAIAVSNATPARGAGAAGTQQAFQFTLSDSKGPSDFGIVNVLINDFVDGRHACYLAYAAAANTLYLVDDAGNAGGPFAGSMQLNGSGSVRNSQCTVTGAGSSAAFSGNNLTLTLNLSFGAAFKGNRILYVAGRDRAEGNNTDWQAMGTWTVQ